MTLFSRLGVVLAIVVSLCQSASAQGLGERRVALVIGNGGYTKVAKLPNPTRDSATVETLLKAAGFEVVHRADDLGVASLKRALRDFSEHVRNADIAIVFFAGHGIEVNGVNYLIPVDAALERDFDVDDEAVSLERVNQILEPAKRLRLVILDACRDNPFVRTMKRTLASRSIGRGLAKIEVQTSDTLIAYAAKAGSTAADGDGANSPYTTALVKHLTTPGLDVRLALGRVRDEVLRSTASKQEPFVYGSLGGAEISLVAAARPEVASANPRDLHAKQEWEKLQTSFNAEELFEFIKKFNGTREALLAIDHVRNIKAVGGAHSPAPSQNPPGTTDNSKSWYQRMIAYMSSLGSKKNGGQLPTTNAEDLKVPAPERDAWQVALYLDTQSAYADFAEKWPTSIYRSQALAARSKLESATPVTIDAVAVALKSSRQFIDKHQTAFRKIYVGVDSIDDADMKQCTGDRRALSVLRGMGHAFAVYGIAANALNGKDLNVLTNCSLFEGRPPRDFAANIGIKGVSAAIEKLRTGVPAFIQNSSDVKEFARELLKYKVKFDKRATDDKIRQIALDTNVQHVFADETSPVPCFNNAVQFVVGTDKNPDADGVNDNVPFGACYMSTVPHKYFYNFWYRRKLEGSSEVAAFVLRRVAAQ